MDTTIEQTQQDAPISVPTEPGAMASEAQSDQPALSPPKPIPEPIPEQELAEEQNQTTEAQPELISQQADTLMTEVVVCSSLHIQLVSDLSLLDSPKAITYTPTPKAITCHASTFYPKPKCQWHCRNFHHTLKSSFTWGASSSLSE